MVYVVVNPPSGGADIAISLSVGTQKPDTKVVRTSERASLPRERVSIARNVLLIFSPIKIKLISTPTTTPIPAKLQIKKLVCRTVSKS